MPRATRRAKPRHDSCVAAVIGPGESRGKGLAARLRFMCVRRVRGRRHPTSRAAPVRSFRLIAAVMILPALACDTAGTKHTDEPKRHTQDEVVGVASEVARWNSSEAYEAGDLVTFQGRTWEAKGAVAVGHVPLGTGDGSDPDQELLLSRREGFGRRVTGGYVPGSSMEVVHVTTARDSGRGSLRRAVSGDDPRWIVFDGDYNIQLASGLLVGSNKTIDGRGRDILIQAPDDGDEDNWGLQIYDESNIVVHNVRIDECGDYTRQAENDQYDCIDLQAANRIWIDHVTLSKAADKLIGISSGTRNVTVSWSHFWENVSEENDTDFQQQVFQVGNMFGDPIVERRSTVTSHHNYFDDTGYRHPLISFGKAHAYNNLVYSFSFDAMHAQLGAQLFAEANIFVNTEAEMKDAIKYRVDGDGCSDDGTICVERRNGYVKAENNVGINSRINANRPKLVFDPGSIYPYTVDLADDTLRTLLVGFSGWQPVVWEPCC